MDNKKEVRLQKGLTLSWLGCLASIPFTGPLGLIGAATIFTGQVMRLTGKKGSWDAYCGRVLNLSENSNENIDLDYNLPSLPSPLPDFKSDYTLPTKHMTNFMKRENERKAYESSLDNGRKMIREYLSNLPYEDYFNINEIEIIEKNKTFLGFSTGKKSLEVKIK